MKIFAIKYSAALLAACVLILTQSSAYAQNAETKAQVQFTEGEGPTSPVHPEFPDTDSNIDPVEGSLVIVSVSDFYFGTIPVMSTAQLYDIETTMPNIQVVDLRGTAAGWKVSATLTSFQKTEPAEEGESLPGASIFIYDGRPNSLSTSPAPVQALNVELTADEEPATILTAPVGAGTGLWVMRWYPPGAGAYIKLYVPAGSATIGSHMATINWILENTPS